MKKYYGLDLIRELSEAFGPSGCEDGLRSFIRVQVEDTCDGIQEDRAGNLIVRIKGRGVGYNAASPERLMLCAHMDEVGFMVREITEEGYLKFSVIGDIDPRVLCGRHLRVGNETHTVKGVIATKAIHMQSADERKHVTPANKLYIDIGAKNAEEAAKLTGIGDYATFDSGFLTFGKDGRYMKGKALDGRCGVAALIEVLRDLHGAGTALPFDVYVAFTTCGEIGIRGAAVAAYTVRPTMCIVVEGQDANDLPDTAPAAVTARLGEGGVLSLADRQTLYDMNMVRATVSVAGLAGIRTQIKHGTTGANDAGAIQRSLAGVRVMALSMPARYTHSASVVALYEDYEAVRELLKVMLRDWTL